MAVVVLFAAMAVYLGYYIWRSGRETYVTAPVVAETVGISAEVTGIVVRGETAVTGGLTYCYYELPSGERIAAGATAAYVTDSAEAMDSLCERRALEGEIARTKLVLGGISASDSYSLAQRDAAARDGVIALAAARCSGGWAALDAASAALGSVLMGGTGEADAARLASLQAELDALGAEGEGCIRVAAPEAGLFFSSLDGYAALSPEALGGLTVSGLRAIISAEGEIPGDAVGRIVYSYRWYYAAETDAQSALSLTVGGRATLLLDGCSAGIDARVDHISAAEGGSCAVVFSSTLRMEETALLRLTSGSVLCSSVSGLRIPAGALHTDGDGADFVYAVEARQVQIKYVTVLSRDENGLLVEGDGSENALAAGDSVIVGGEDMYEGMLIE